MARQAQVKKEEMPEGWSLEAVAFINKVTFSLITRLQLLKRKPLERLGVNGHKEVKSHPWLHHFPWQQLHEKKLRAPFVPHVRSDCKTRRKVKTLTQRAFGRNGRTMRNLSNKMPFFQTTTKCKISLRVITLTRPYRTWGRNMAKSRLLCRLLLGIQLILVLYIDYKAITLLYIQHY